MHLKCSKIDSTDKILYGMETFQAYFENKLVKCIDEKAIKSQSIRDLKGIRNETEPLFDSV